MIRICSSLARHGHQVCLVGRRLPESTPLADRAFRQKRLRCFFRKGKLFYLEYNLRLLLYLLSQKTDIIHAVDLDTILPAVVCKWWKRVRVIYDAHEYFTETPEVVRRPTVQRIWARLADRTIHRVDAAITVGPALAGIMSERYGRTFGCVRNVPQTKPFPAIAEREEPPVILYQGALNEGRGLETIITAMRSIPNAQLWLAGEGDLSESLREQANDQAFRDRIHFLGFVNPEELTKLTPKATLGLNLLENKGLSYYYSLANKAFDYIHAGVPAIHMDFPEYRSLADRYGAVVLLDELSPTPLARLINDLLANPDRLKQLRTACKLAAPQLTWEQEEKTLLEYYPALK
jgi:glycosyltransferase involved in cell wall biosynthesis